MSSDSWLLGVMLLALLSACSTGGESAGTAGLAPLTAPLGDLKLPYVHRGVLRVGALDAVAPMGELLASGESVLATDYSWVAGEDMSATWVFRDGDMVRLPMLDNAQLRLSHDGERVVALSHPNPSSTRLSVHRLPSGVREGQVDLPLAGRCCGGHDPVNLLGFDPAGRVFFNAEGRSHMWDLADEVVPVAGAPGLVVQVGPGGVAAKPGAGARVLGTVLGDVRESGQFRPRLKLPTADATEGIAWSPSGTHVAYTAQHGTVIDSLGDRKKEMPLDLGDAVFSHFVGFEDDTTLLLMAREGGQHVLLRCKPATQCEVVQELPGANSLDHWTFPSR